MQWPLTARYDRRNPAGGMDVDNYVTILGKPLYGAVGLKRLKNRPVATSGKLLKEREPDEIDLS